MARAVYDGATRPLATGLHLERAAEGVAVDLTAE